MLHNLALAANAVAPIFLMILTGFGIKTAGMLDAITIKKLNKMLFNVLMPFIVYDNIYGATLNQAFDFKLFAYCISISLIMWLFTIAVVMKIEKEAKSCGAMIQAINRTNFLVISFQIIQNLYSGANLTEAAFITVGILLINSAMPIIILEAFRGNRPDFKELVKEVAINPIILATVAGAVTISLGISFPAFVEKTISSLNHLASQLALIVIGATLEFRRGGLKLKKITICVIGKLIVIPAIACGLGILLGFKGTAFVTILAFFAGPTTSTSYTVAEEMGSDGPLSRDCIVISSAIVPLTMMLWIFLFKSLQLF